MPGDPQVELTHIERVPAGTSPQEIEERFIQPAVPAILEGLASSWPAAQWSMETLRARLGDKEVNARSKDVVSEGRGGFYGGGTIMRFSEFLDEMAAGKRDIRMTAENLVNVFPELIEDLREPAVGTGYSRKLLWIFLGSSVSRTPLHYDFDWRHLMHTVFFGTKRFILFPQSASSALHKIPFAARSHFDPLAPDYARFPRARGLKGLAADLKAGDTLFLPAGTWHDVRHTGPSCAVSQRFNNGNAFMWKAIWTLLTAPIGDRFEARARARLALPAPPPSA